MGAAKDEIYKCEACGNVVLVLEGGEGDLVCCGENMRLITGEETTTYLNRLPRPGTP